VLQQQQIQTLFYPSIINLLRESMQIPSPECPRSPKSYVPIILDEISQKYPEFVDPTLNVMLEWLPAKKDASQKPLDKKQIIHEIERKNICAFVRVLTRRVDVLPDNRPLMEKLFHLTDKHNRIDAWHGDILRAVHSWSNRKEFAYGNYFLLVACKEYAKASGESMIQLYLEAMLHTLDILTRDYGTQKYLGEISVGLSSVEQEHFLELFQRDMPKTVVERLLYIMNPSFWEIVSSNGRMVFLAMAMLPLLDNEAHAKLAHLHATFSMINNNNNIDSSDEVGMATESDDLWEKERHFIVDECASVTQKDVSSSLCSILSWEQNYGASAQTLWSEIFCSIWKHATDEQRERISAALNTLLISATKPMYTIPNGIQCMVDAAFQCEPAMKLPHDTIRYVARTFNTWHTAFEWIARDGPDSNDLFWLGKMYEDIAEPDHASALLSKSFAKYASADEVKDALTLQKFGAYHGARKIYMGLMNAVLKNTLPQQKITKHEMNFWESNWIECTRRLGQWEFLVEYSKTQDVDLLELSVETLWRLNRVDQLKDALSRCPDQSPTMMQAIQQAQLTSWARVFMESKDPIIQKWEKKDAHDPLLKNWQLAPPLSSRAHTRLENAMQQLVETSEGQVVFSKLSEATKKTVQFSQQMQQLQQQIQQIQQQQQQQQTPQQQPPQLQLLQQQVQQLQQQRQRDLQHLLGSLKTTFNIWEERLPNVWEDVMLWSDTFCWRTFVLSEVNRLVVNIYPPQPQQYVSNELLLLQQFLGWHIVTLADVNLKHDLPDVCLSILNRIQKLKNIKIDEAQRKMRGHIKCELARDNPRQAFEVLQKINLSLFDPPNVAYFMRLKGVLYNRLGHPELAHYCFSTAVKTCPMLTAGWASWAKFLEEQMMTLSSGGQLKSALSSQLPVTDASRMAEEAMAAYIQALRCSTTSEAAQRYGKSPMSYSAHALWLLGQSMAGSSVQTAFTNGIVRVPYWTWIPWTQQLIDMVLAERTHVVARDLLTHISTSDPYSVFNLVFAVANGFHARNSNPTSMARADGLLNDMRVCRPYMLSRLETASLALARSLLPNPLETLVVRMEQLVLRAGDVNLSNIAGNSEATSAAAFQEAAKTIASELESAGDAVKNGILPFFKSTFDPLISNLCTALNAPPSPTQFDDLKAAVLALMNKCIHWLSELRAGSTIPENRIRIRGLKCNFLDGSPLQLRTISPCLSSVSFVRDLEVPGQYYGEGEPSHRRHVLISFMHPEVFVLTASTRFQRCVGFIGNNGQAYFYRVMSALHCPEDVWTLRDSSRDQLVRAVSSALRTEVCARSRGVFLRPPTSVPMSDSVELVSLPLIGFTFWQIFELWTRSNPRSIDTSSVTDPHTLQRSMLTPHYQPLITAIENAGESTMLLTTLYNEIPDHVVRSLLSHLCSSMEALFELIRCFRLKFVARSAIDLVLNTHASAMSHYLLFPESPTSGAETLNYHAPYAKNDQSPPVSSSQMPRLRLTRNVMRVLGEPGGYTATKDALVATLLALQSKREKLALFLRMHYLNEYNIDAITKPSAVPPQPNDDHQTARIRHDAALARLDALCPKKFSSLSDDQRILQTDANVTKLMEEAMAPSNIVSYPHSWYPWV